jgi:hypothetical protein
VRYPSEGCQAIEGTRNQRHQRRGYGEGSNVAREPFPGSSAAQSETGDGSRVGPRKRRQPAGVRPRRAEGLWSALSPQR